MIAHNHINLPIFVLATHDFENGKEAIRERIEFRVRRIEPSRSEQMNEHVEFTPLPLICLDCILLRMYGHA